MRLTVVAMLLFPSLHGVTLAAQEDDDFVTLRSLRLNHSMHLLWRVVFEEPIELRLSLDAEALDGQMVAYGFWIWKEGTPSTEGMFSGGGTVYGSPARVYAQSDAVPVSLKGRVATCPLGEIEMLGEGCTVEGDRSTGPLEPGAWLALAMVGFDGRAKGDLVLEASASVSFSEERWGNAFLDREEQFVGDGTILVENGIGGSNKIMRNVSVSHELTRSFFGYFLGTTETGLLSMSYTGPEGSGNGRPLYVFSDAPAGAYRFTVDRDIETLGGDVWVLGADVNLP